MRIAVVVLAVFASACTSADVLRVDLTPRAEVIGQGVPVLLDEPKEPYQTIALVEVASSWGASLARMGRRLSAEAAKLGGNAVLLTQRLHSSSTSLVPIGDSFLSLDNSDSRIVGKVIVYRSDTAADLVAAAAKPPQR